LGALAGIPLQWFALGASPIGELRLHQLAMFGFTACIIAYYGLKRIGEATRRLQFFILANLYMLTFSAAMDVYNKGIPVQPMQTLLYVISFTAVSAYFFKAASEDDFNIIDALRWSGLVTSTLLILAFALSLLKNNQSALGRAADNRHRRPQHPDPAALRVGIRGVRVRPGHHPGPDPARGLRWAPAVDVHR
jgi:hypothetical protein